jgi:hypothetical protein
MLRHIVGSPRQTDRDIAMISMQRRSKVRLAVLFVMSSVPAALAQTSTQSPSPIEGLEYAVEIGAHERLIKVKKGATLTPFATDGCSGGLSAGWAFVSSTLPAFAKHHGGLPPWERCCVAHDRLYHEGGPPDADPAASFATRRAADEGLRQCVMHVDEERRPALAAAYGLNPNQVTQLYRTIADIMYRAVRLGGGPCTGLSWRWGFGWPQCE